MYERTESFYFYIKKKKKTTFCSMKDSIERIK